MKFFLKLVCCVTCLVLQKTTLATAVCDNVCACKESNRVKNKTDVDCSRTFLNIIPPADTWPQNTYELDLSGNNITIVDVAYTHDGVRVLKLNENRIRTVKASVFSGLNNLKELDLSKNELEEIEDHTFHGLINLETLILSHNKIKALNDFTFSELISVRDLSLSNNKIVHITNSNWNRMYELNKLDLSNIGAYTLEANLFHGFDKLAELDISQNDFAEVPIMALRSAKNLRWLRLNDNPIEKLDKNSFMKLDSLSELLISFMENMVTIGPGAFSDMKNLNYLEVSGNRKLSYIDRDAFKGLFENVTSLKLKRVSLQNNQLSSLAPLPCSRLEKMNLQGNPWSCTCRMRWIKKCLIAEIYAADLKCSKPEKLKGKLVVDIPIEQFMCDQLYSEPFENLHQNRVVRATSVALGCVLLVVLGMLIISILKWRNIRDWYRNYRKGPGSVYYVRARANPMET